MFAAPSMGSVTSRRNVVMSSSWAATRAVMAGRRTRGHGPPRLRSRRLWGPPEPRLTRRECLVEPTHRRGHGSVADELRVRLRLAGDLDHRVAELVERLLRLRLRWLDHQRLLDDERKVDGGRVEPEVEQALGDVGGRDAEP